MIKVYGTVFDFTIQDYTTQEPLAVIQYAQNVGFEQNYEKTEIRGGSSNASQYINYHTPTSSFKASLPLIDDNVMVVKTGAVKKTGAQLNAHTKAYTVSATNTVELGVTPAAGTLKINNFDENGNLGTAFTAVAGSPTEEQYSISGTTLTFNAAKTGSLVYVMCDYTTGSDATGQVIADGKLPSLVRIVGNAISEDKDGNQYIETLIVEKAKPDPSFTFDTTAGTPASLDFNCEVFPVTNEDGDLQFIRTVVDPDLEV